MFLYHQLLCSVSVFQNPLFKCELWTLTPCIFTRLFSFSPRISNEMLVIINAFLLYRDNTLTTVILYANVLNLWLSVIIRIEKIGCYVTFNFCYLYKCHEKLYTERFRMIVTCKDEKIKLISVVKNSENMRNWQILI